MRCLADNGRLLEIGKYDILKGTPLSMRPMLRNCAFEGIDLDRIVNDPSNITEVCSVFMQTAGSVRSLHVVLQSPHPWSGWGPRADAADCHKGWGVERVLGCVLSVNCSLQAWEVHALLAAGIASGEVVPLPLNRFARKEAGNAFRFMAAGTSPKPSSSQAE